MENEPIQEEDTGVDESNIVFVRLQTGEDLLSMIEPIKEDDKSILLIFPLKIVYLHNDDDPTKLTIKFMQWVFDYICDQQEFEVFHDDIITISEPSPEMKHNYIECIQNQLDSMGDTGSFELDNEEGKDQSPEGMDLIKPGNALDLFKNNLRRGNSTLH